MRVFKKNTNKTIILLLISLIIFLSIPAMVSAEESDFTSHEDKVAVLFGMYDYPGTVNDLLGPPNDVAAMQVLLEEDGYTVYVYENVNEAEAYSAISTQFEGCGAEDTVLMYYSGHGGTESEESVLYFTDSDVTNAMSATELTSVLDVYSATKVVLLDSCYSGGFINRSLNTEEELAAENEEFNQNVIDAFEEADESDYGGTSISRYLNTSTYKVITASAGDEYSWESYLEGEQRGYFTYYYTKGCGYFNSFNVLPADDNGDGKISQTEIYNYTYDNIISYLFNGTYTQTVQAYPYESGDPDFIIFGDVADPYIEDISIDPISGYAGDTYTTTFTTNDDVDKIAFYSEGVYHSQLFPTSSGVTVTNNGDGTATWTISMKIGRTGERTFSYKAHNEEGWTSLSPVYFTVNELPPPTINSLTIDPTSGYAGDTYTTTLVTDDDVDKIAFYSEGEYHSQLFPTSSGVSVSDNGDGTETWTISKVIGRTGDRTFSYKSHNEIGWSGLLSVNFTVSEIPPPTIDSLTIDPTSGYAGDTYTTTLVTDDNVDKIAFYSEGEYHSQLFPTSSGVAVSDNGDGTATWTISKVIGKTGERTFSYKAHNGSGWSSMGTVNFTVNDVLPPTIDSLTIDPTSGNAGDTYTITLTTDDNVDKLAFYTDGEYHSQIYPTSNGVSVADNGDGSETWTISITIGKTGERTFSYKAHNESGWSSTTSVNFTVEAVVKANLIFVHHSCGSNLLNNGGLAAELNNNMYHVADATYGWGPDSIGNSTDTSDWSTWFNLSDSTYMDALYSEMDTMSATNTLVQAAGENTIIMFKSCYPCSEVGISIDDEKAIYNSLLSYFAAHPDKMFILVTPPPEINISYPENTRELCNWLVDEWSVNYRNTYGDNLYVFDFYNVLTHPDNHHWIVEGVESHEVNNSNNELYYYSGTDNHPTSEGNIKATEEFVPLLNYWYEQFSN